MDKSANICRIYDSFEVGNIHLDSKFPEYYIQTEVIPIKYNPVKINRIELPPSVFVDVPKFDQLELDKDRLGKFGRLTIEARQVTNPFEGIGLSIFGNRAAVKLANCDAMNDLTGSKFTLENKTSSKKLTYCDIASGPGSFTQYLQYRFPNSEGYGITLRDTKLDWDPRIINFSNFTAFYGSDNSGDLYKHWKSFVDFVREKHPEGVDVVVGDGGFDTTDRYEAQEFLSSRLLLTQVLVGINATKIGGNFLVKAFNVVTKLSGQLLFILSQSFEKVVPFKPVSSRPGNGEVYVICLNLKRNPHYELLSAAANDYTDDVYLESLFNEELPVDFVEWLTNLNNNRIERQSGIINNTIRHLEGVQVPKEVYNISKFLKIWALPPGLPGKR